MGRVEVPLGLGQRTCPDDYRCCRYIRILRSREVLVEGQDGEQQSSECPESLLTAHFRCPVTSSPVGQL